MLLERLKRFQIAKSQRLSKDRQTMSRSSLRSPPVLEHLERGKGISMTKKIKAKKFEDLTLKELADLDESRYEEQYIAHTKFQDQVIDLVNKTNYESHFAAATLVRIGAALLRALDKEVADELIAGALEIDNTEVQIHWRREGDEDKNMH